MEQKFYYPAARRENNTFEYLHKVKVIQQLLKYFFIQFLQIYDDYKFLTTSLALRSISLA